MADKVREPMTFNCLKPLHAFLIDEEGTAADWKAGILKTYREAGRDGNLLYSLPSEYGADPIPPNHVYTADELKEIEARLDKDIAEYNPDDYKLF
jgi:hypothetical protein